MSNEKQPLSNEKLFAFIQDSIAEAIAKASQSAAGADASIGTTRARSVKDTDSVNDTIFKTVEQVTDTNAPEALAGQVVSGAGKNRTHFDTMISNSQSYLEELRTLKLQGLQNNQNHSNVANGGLIDRFWNVNETDAYAVLLNKSTGEVLSAAAAYFKSQGSE